MSHQIPQHIEIGKIGEDIACKYLKSKGYEIIERNFRRKWGEIDIVCKKKNLDLNNDYILKKSIFNNTLSCLKNIFQKYNSCYLEPSSTRKIVFVEVKTLKSDSLNPEDNVTKSKQKKLIRTCELYLSNKKFDLNTDWQIDVIAIKLNGTTKKAKINHLENAVYYS